MPGRVDDQSCRLCLPGVAKESKRLQNIGCREKAPELCQSSRKTLASYPEAFAFLQEARASVGACVGMHDIA